MEKIITYFGQPAKVGCDEKCNKAWGMNSRPRIYTELGELKIFGLENSSIYPDENIDFDNYVYCSDDELGIAPIDPGTYEGGDSKPKNKEEMGNKWCIRQCERCAISDVGKHEMPLEFEDFSQRVNN